jgi:GNAT superfamily N-acetyltransferase
MGPVLFPGYLAATVDVAARLTEALLLVAEHDGDLVGTITLYADATDEGMPAQFPARTAGIRAVAVDPRARGQGVGGALLDAAIRRSIARGAQWIGLHTVRCMVAATRLYEGRGFQRAPANDFLANDFFSAGAGEPMIALAYLRPVVT